MNTPLLHHLSPLLHPPGVAGVELGVGAREERRCGYPRGGSQIQNDKQNKQM